MGERILMSQPGEEYKKINQLGTPKAKPRRGKVGMISARFSRQRGLHHWRRSIGSGGVGPWISHRGVQLQGEPGTAELPQTGNGRNEWCTEINRSY